MDTQPMEIFLHRRKQGIIPAGGHPWLGKKFLVAGARLLHQEKLPQKNSIQLRLPCNRVSLIRSAMRAEASAFTSPCR